MKKIVFISLILPFFVFSQSTDQNFVKTIVYKQATQTTISNPSASAADVQVTYYNGIGQPMQFIASKQSHLGNDIITPVVYDNFGIPVYDYLPYPSSNATMAYDPIVTTKYSSNPLFLGEVPYGKTECESSPFSRVIRRGMPGNDWQLSSNVSIPDHSVKSEYEINTNADQVILYKAVSSDTNYSSNGYYSTSLSNLGFYTFNTLYKSITKDENWTGGKNNTKEVFTDRDGRTILKRVYANYGSTYDVPHDTYYVYDQYGNLSYMIPPLVTNTTTQLETLCYQYRYDYKNRLVEKRIPGKDWEFIIYDKLNRIVATGPHFSPFKEDPNIGWNIVKYDVFNRRIYTGWYSETQATSGNRKILQDAQNNISVYTMMSESRTSAYTLNNITIAYTNNVFPTSGFYLLTVDYFDNYTFPNSQAVPSSIEGQLVLTNPRGLPTGSWNRVLTNGGEFNGNTTTLFYDKKSKAVRNYTQNYLTGYTKVDRILDFIGLPQSVITYHKMSSSTSEIKTTENFIYSSQGRLLSQTQQTGTSSSPGPIELISEVTYDELGRIMTKKVGRSSVNPLQRVDYTYNIRGWLTGVNNINLLQESDPVDLFAFKINYNLIEGSVTGVNPSYNGNISETYWRTNSDDRIRKYGYEYDGMSRLLNATYQKPQSVSPIPNSYRESLEYDKNGNITHLIRNGGLDSDTDYLSAIQIDDLSYTYNNNSNQIAMITDATNHPDGFNNAVDNSSEYAYDFNGNMIRDDNKGITSVRYNHLDLPIEISFNNDANTKIVYIYNAIGQKVQKKVYQYNPPPGLYTPITVTTDYLDGFQYTNSVLKFFPTSEGYVSNTVVSGSNVYKYVYNYKDHLGNIRLSFGLNSSGITTIMEENHYYPFGLKHSDYNTEQYHYAKMPSNEVNLRAAAPATIPLLYKYKFGGKEFQDELSLNVYDYGARNYDPAIGRFMSIDSKAGKYRDVSPYTYALNNPVYYGDIDGNEPTPYEAALMAAHVYNNTGKLVGGWEQSAWWQDNKNEGNGLQGTMYSRRKADGTEEFAFVYAGTDPSKGNDWKNNLTQVLGLSSQYSDAVTLAQSMSDYAGDNELTFVGHSLGGGLSNLSSLVTGRTSITFNPAWISFLTKTVNKNKIVQLKGDNHRTNYVHESDPLNKIQEMRGWIVGLKEIGETVEVEGGWSMWDSNIVNGHMMEEMIESIEDNGDATHHKGNKDDEIVKAKPEKGFIDKLFDTKLLRDNGIRRSDED